MAHYVFDNAWEWGRERLNSVEALLDPGTIRHLEALRVASGWQCLEVGAGGGSIARWLCHQVGEGGQVIATDIDTRFLEALDEPNLVVRRHDIVHDALSESSFDLIHARLVLEHLPSRYQVLQRMTAALKPGGSPGARWFRLSMEQLRGTLVGPGKLQQHAVDKMLELFEDPNFAALSPVVMAAWGRRPPRQSS